MATSQEKLIFTVETIVKGQQDLVRMSETLIQIQTKQAAAAQQSAAANAKTAAALDGLHGKTLMATSSVTAFATAYTAASAAMEQVLQLLENVREGMEAVNKEGFEAERWQRQFEVMTKSPEAASAAMAKFKHFVMEYNIPEAEVVNAAAHLQRVGLLTDQALKTVSDAATTYGMSMEDVASRMSQVARGNLRGFLDLVPAATSSVLKAQQEIEGGMRKSPQALRMLAREALADLDAQVRGGTEKFARETESKLTGISERFDQFREDIYKAGWGEGLTFVVDEVITQLKRMRDDGSLSAWSQAIGGAVRAGGQFLSYMIRAVPPVLDLLRFVGPIAGAALLGVAFTSLAASIAATGGIAYALRIVAFQGGSLVRLFPALTAGVSSFGQAVNTALGPVGWAIIAVTALNVALDSLDANTMKPFKIEFDVDSTSRSDLVASLHALTEKRLALLQDAADFNASSTASMGASQATSAQTADNRLASLTRQAKIAQDAIDKVGVALGKIDAGDGVFGPKPSAAPDDPTTKDERALINERVKVAREAQTAMEKDATEATRVVLEQIKLRVDATGAEGLAKVELFDLYAREVYGNLVASGQLRADKEAAIEADVADRRLMIMRTSTGAARTQMLQELRDFREKELAANDAVYESGMFERRTAAATQSERDKLKAAGDAKAAADHAASLVDDARFERDLYGETTDQYIAHLRKRLAALAETSIDAQKLKRELEDALRTKADRNDLVKAATVRNENAGGLSGADAKAAAEIEADARRVADYQRDMETATFFHRVALLDEFKGLHGKAWDDMSAKEKQAHIDSLAQAKSWTAQMSHGPKVAFDFIKKQAKELMLSEEKRYAVAKFLTQNNAKEAIAAALEAASGELKARAIVNAELALEGLARALIFHDPSALAGAAAAAEAAAMGGAASIALAGLARTERASIAQDERDRQVGGMTAQQQAIQGTAGASSVSLTVSQGNQPITMHFYNNVSFVGGVTYFGQQGAREFAQTLGPYIQEMFDTHQLRVA